MDYLVAFTPPSSSSEHGYGKKVLMTKGALAGNYSQENTVGDVNKRNTYDGGNSQADPVS